MVTSNNPGAPLTSTASPATTLSASKFNAKGLIGPALNILASIFGGQQTQSGLGDLESQIQGGIGEEQRALQQALAGLRPFQQTGATAGASELALLQQGQDPAGMINAILGKFQQSPAQQAAIQAGLGAVSNRAIAQGLGQSGAEQKALEQFAQTQTANQAQQFLNSVLAGRGQTLSGLGQLSGQGLGAAQAGAQAGMRTSEDISSLLGSLGQAQLGGAQQQGSEFGNILGDVGSIASLFL